MGQNNEYKKWREDPLIKKLPRLIITKVTGVNGYYYSVSLVYNNERSEQFCPIL